MVGVDTNGRAGAVPARASIGSRARHWARRTLPLSLRKQLAVFIARRSWLPQRYWWSKEMVRDLAERDASEYHRFLWSNHLGYAETYEIEQRYGSEQVHASRRLLFDDLLQFLRDRSGTHSQPGVRSVLEVGCSMGYLLRHMEQAVFPAADRLDGIDIDAYAVAQGQRHLERLGSRVRLVQGDMLEVGDRFDTVYDVVLCAGVLMYVPESQAAAVVKAMLARTRGLLVLAGLAHPDDDNLELPRSAKRGSDQSFIHNLDSLVARAGGRVLRRRWEGARAVDGNTIYFVFAEPGHGPDPSVT